jgi:hypothetical protein
MSTSTQLRQDAEAKFKRKEIQRLDGCAAMAEYEAAGRATLERTARLRALRLSREAVATPAPTKLRASAKLKTPAKLKKPPTAKRAKRVAAAV